MLRNAFHLNTNEEPMQTIREDFRMKKRTPPMDVYTFRIPTDLHATLVLLARREHLQPSSLFRRILYEHCERVR